MDLPVPGGPTINMCGTIDPNLTLEGISVSTLPKAFSYLRFSTPAQMLGDSFRRQTSLAQRYALDHGLELDEGLTFHDLGVSAYRGANVETGRLADFKEAVTMGLVPRGSYLLVEALDRLSRLTPWKAVRVLQDIVELDIKVVTLNDGKLYTPETLEKEPVDLLIAMILFMRANEESLTKGRRLKAAWEGKRLQAGNRPLTASCPGWLTLDKGTQKFIIDDSKAAIIRTIFTKLRDGVGLEFIAKELNQQGVKPFGRGLMWRRSYIQKLRDNPAVVGTFIPHKDEYTAKGKTRVPLEQLLNYYPSVVDDETFHEVLSMTQSKSPRTKIAYGIQSILAGLAACPKCGGSMTRITKGSGTKSGRPYLICAAAKIGKGCQYRSVRIDDVEQGVMLGMGQVLAAPPLPDAAKEDDRQNLESGLAALKDMRGEVLEAIAIKALPSLVARLEEVEDSISHTEESLKQIEVDADFSNYRIILKRVNDLFVTINEVGASKERINAQMRQVFKKVVVDYETGHLEFEWKQGGVTSFMYAWVDTVPLLANPKVA